MLRHLGPLGLCCLLLVGCVTDPEKRLALAEQSEKERDLNLRIVSDVADFGNDGPLQVHGVGLVTGLAGTGHSPDGEWRKMMENFLLKNIGPRNGELKNVPRDQNVRQILDNPNNCLVIVSAYIPAGCRKGDRFDIDVKLPYGSKATSLMGGHLLHCTLHVYEALSNLSNSPKYQNSKQMIGGHVFADAKGQLVVAFGANVDENEKKRGKVWQGGISRIARPYQLMMRNDEKSHRIANDVAQRINFMYQDDPRSKALHADFTRQENRLMLEGLVTNQINKSQDPSGMNPSETAKAMSKEFINVRVPFVYRFNHERFMIVSGFTPVYDTDPVLPKYRERLKKMLIDPRDTMAAAMRIESMGRDRGIELLLPGLKSDHPFVRFASAEALAYLGSTAGVDELTKLVKEYAVFVKHGTIALASLGESICKDKLGELIVSDDPALRCAAFHAQSLLNDREQNLGGMFLNDTLWLHRIPQAAGAMVYFSTTKRPQVILFGRGITIAPGTRMMFGDFTVAQGEHDDRFYVKHITANWDERRDQRVSSNRLDDILMKMTDLNATYPDIVAFLRMASDRQYVNCPIVTWTTLDVPLETLILTGRQMTVSR